MDTGQPSLKRASVVALGAIAVLFAGAIIFFRERLFADTSFIVFNIINYQKLTVQNQRYGSFITQIVPDILQKLHLPLKTILIGYAISFNLFFLAVASILHFRLRQYALVIIMGLYYFLLVSDSYYLANDELHQAIAWMFLLLGLTLYLGDKKANIFVILVLFLILAFLTLFTHFIAAIPTLFLLVYFIIEQKSWPFSKKNTILLSLMIVAIAVIKFMVSGDSQRYEQEHLHHLTHFSIKDIITSFSTPVVSMFCYRCLTNYWLAIIMFVVSITALFKNNKRPLAAWALASFIGYFILMGLIYVDESEFISLFHIETEWESLGIIIATPFVFEVLPKMKQNMAIGILVFIFITRLAYIGYSAPSFTWRVHFHERVLAQMKKKGITKLALYYEKELGDRYILNWTTPYESLFQSAMDGDKPQRTFMFVHPDKTEILEFISHPEAIYLSDPVPPKDINHNYFLIDTTHPYAVMTYEQLFK